VLLNLKNAQQVITHGW